MTLSDKALVALFSPQIVVECVLFTVTIPCEFCGQLCDADDLVQHQVSLLLLHLDLPLVFVFF